MSDTPPIHQSSSKRKEPRISVPDLQATVRKQGLLSGKPMPCEVVDINRGGMGVVSDTLLFKILQKVVLYVSYQQHQYCIRGIVSYRHFQSGKMYYGVIFVFVPHQFDQLIEKWMELSKAMEPHIADTQKKHEFKTQTVPGTQRRIELRNFKPQGLKVEILHSSRFGTYKYGQCEVLDISCGGISIMTETARHKLMDKVKFKITIDGQTHQATGVVSYYQPVQNGYQYGVEFTSVHPKLVRLIENLPSTDK